VGLVQRVLEASAIPTVALSMIPDLTRAVGVPPNEYLFSWRMAMAKDLLRQHDISLVEIAERVGYSSASTFSTAFSRHVGQPPSHYARQRLSLASG